MKCKNCRGTGERHTINWETGKVYIVQGEKCPVCGGKGDIEQTNEEWLRSATFEEMAGAIYEWYSLGYSMGKRGKKLNPITEVVGWLKEPHKE